MLRMLMVVLSLTALVLAAPAGTLAAPQNQEEEGEAPPEDAPPAPDASQPVDVSTLLPPDPDPTMPFWLLRNDEPLPLGAQIGGLIEYQRFWERRTDAMQHPGTDRELDLMEVMGGGPLQDELAVLHDLRRAGQALAVRVENHPVLMYASQNQFVIYDEYVDSSYVVDASTRQPVGPGPGVEPETVSMAYLLRKTPDPRFANAFNWKVVDSIHIAPAGE